MNSPLGAVRSSTATASTAIAKLREALAADEPATRDELGERAIRALEGSVELTLRAGERLSEVMATLSRFVHLDRAQRQPVDLAACVGDAARLVEPRASEGVTLSVNVPPGLVVDGDAARLSQAFTTVLRNAAEAIDGTGAVRVSASADGESVIVSVRDDGRGMAENQVAELFRIEFASGQRVRARFGLAACQSVIHGHGGEIEVESRVGAGTEVRIRLPRRLDDEG